MNSVLTMFKGVTVTSPTGPRPCSQSLVCQPRFANMMLSIYPPLPSPPNRQYLANDNKCLSLAMLNKAKLGS